MIFIWNF